MCSKQSNPPNNKISCAGQETADVPGSLTATPKPEVSSVSSMLSEVSEYSTTATTTTSPFSEHPIATSYSENEREGPRTSVPPPSERTMESSLYTSLYSETPTIFEPATVTFATTTTTAASLPVHCGTSEVGLPAFTGAAAGRVAVVGADVMGGIVALMALL